jgi:hypothetical protein
MKKSIAVLCIFIIALVSHARNLALGENGPGAQVNKDSIRVTVLKSTACVGIKRILVQRADDGGNITNGNSFIYNPGDTLVIPYTGQMWSYVSFTNIHGQPGCPVTIINSGNGQVRMINGISIDGCSYIKVTGSGNSLFQYGLFIQDTMALFDNGGPGVAIMNKSKNIEVERIFIHKKRYGFLIKNEADCDQSINAWILDSMNIHDNKIVNMGSEGMYIGSTDPDNLQRPVTCGGVVYFYKPGQLANVSVYNNIIDSCGRPGIQFSNGRTGQNEIFNNRITNIGTQFDAQQGNAISLGGYSRAYIHDNHIDSTFADGIRSDGSGISRLENNYIGHPGIIFNHTNTTVQAIFIYTYATNPKDSTFWTIKNNQLDSSTGTPARQIYLADDNKTFGYFNYVCNNTKIGSGRPAVIDASNSGSPFPVPIHLFTTGCSAVYTFIGAGNWNDVNNWVNKNMPPSTLPAGQEIVINPVLGDCIMNVPITIAPGGKLTVIPGKKIVIQVSLVMEK